MKEPFISLPFCRQKGNEMKGSFSSRTEWQMSYL